MGERSHHRSKHKQNPQQLAPTLIGSKLETGSVTGWIATAIHKLSFSHATFISARLGLIEKRDILQRAHINSRLTNHCLPNFTSCHGFVVLNEA